MDPQKAKEERNGHTCETHPGACLPCIADTLKDELCGGHPIATCGECERMEASYEVDAS